MRKLLTRFRNWRLQMQFDAVMQRREDECRKNAEEYTKRKEQGND